MLSETALDLVTTHPRTLTPQVRRVWDVCPMRCPEIPAGIKLPLPTAIACSITYLWTYLVLTAFPSLTYLAGVFWDYLQNKINLHSNSHLRVCYSGNPDWDTTGQEKTSLWHGSGLLGREEFLGCGTFSPGKLWWADLPSRKTVWNQGSQKKRKPQREGIMQT